MGCSSADDPGRTELSLAYGTWRRRAAFRVEAPLLVVPAEASDEELKAAALAHDRVQAKLDGRQIVKTIVVPKRLVNLVAK